MQGITFNHTFVLVKQSPVRERNDIIKLFVDKINMERLGSKFPQVKFVAIQRKCVAMDDGQLYGFYHDCEKARCGFSKYFFWSLNPKKHGRT